MKLAGSGKIEERWRGCDVNVLSASTVTSTRGIASTVFLPVNSVRKPFANSNTKYNKSLSIHHCVERDERPDMAS